MQVMGDGGVHDINLFWNHMLLVYITGLIIFNQLGCNGIIKQSSPIILQ
jgi:hypothetical protein